VRPIELMHHVRLALSGDGPAILPVPEECEPTVVGEVPQRVAVVIETSGSMGSPKRVMLSADAICASATASSGVLGGHGQWLLALPAHYVAGAQVLIRSIVGGTEPVVMPDGHFDPHVFAQRAETLTGGRRFLSVVPAQLARIVEYAIAEHATDERVASAQAAAAQVRDDGARNGQARGGGAVLAAARRFDAILVGGQAIDPTLHSRALELGLRVRLTYGASETCGGCVYDGVPIGDTGVRIVGGEIELCGSVLAEGYCDDPHRTARSFVNDSGVRWYRTGDIGDIVGGRVVVRGRADNVIISGGVKVPLDVVERVVQTIPGLGNAVVVSGYHPEWGQTPVVAYTSSTDIAFSRFAKRWLMFLVAPRHQPVPCCCLRFLFFRLGNQIDAPSNKQLTVSHTQTRTQKQKGVQGANSSPSGI
jgi:O-succinylbenzoic acid--CoA ligase